MALHGSWPRTASADRSFLAEDGAKGHRLQIVRSRADFAQFSEMSENRETGWWRGVDSNCRYRFLNLQTTTFRRRLQRSDEAKIKRSGMATGDRHLRGTCGLYRRTGQQVADWISRRCRSDQNRPLPIDALIEVTLATQELPSTTSASLRRRSRPLDYRS